MGDHYTSLDGPESSVSVRYLKELPDYNFEKPYYISGKLPEEAEKVRTNIQYQTLGNVSRFNLRGREQTIKLGLHGFEILRLNSEIASLDARSLQKDIYIENVTSLVKELLASPFVLCYDCRFRSSKLGNSGPQDGNPGTSTQPDKPAEAAHIDLTPQGAAGRIQRHMTDQEAHIYLNEAWRIRVVNVWKPLSIVEDWDLMLCDHTSVKSTDIIAVDRVSDEYVGEVYMLKPKEDYRWYWFDHQRPDEATIFVSYDSCCGFEAPYCPHTSVKNPEATSEAGPRESVELRLIVLTPIAPVE